MKETLPILDYFKKEGKVVTVQGEAEPEQSYNNMINAFKTSDIAGLKEFIEGQYKGWKHEVDGYEAEEHSLRQDYTHVQSDLEVHECQH